jgi:hypothetical protein
MLLEQLQDQITLVRPVVEREREDESGMALSLYEHVPCRLVSYGELTAYSHDVMELVCCFEYHKGQFLYCNAEDTHVVRSSANR